MGIAVGSVFPSPEKEEMTAAEVVVGFASLTEAEEAEGVAVALLPGWLTHGGKLCVVPSVELAAPPVELDASVPFTVGRGVVVWLVAADVSFAPPGC